MSGMSALRGEYSKVENYFSKSGNSSDIQKGTEVYWTFTFSPLNWIFKTADICEGFCVLLPRMHLSPRWILKAMFIIPRNVLVLLLYMCKSPEIISSPDNLISSPLLYVLKPLYKWHHSIWWHALLLFLLNTMLDIRHEICSCLYRQFWFVYFPCGRKLKMLLAKHKKQRKEKLLPADPLGPICVFWKGSVAYSFKLLEPDSAIC